MAPTHLVVIITSYSLNFKLVGWFEKLCGPHAAHARSGREKRPAITRRVTALADWHVSLLFTGYELLGPGETRAFIGGSGGSGMEAALAAEKMRGGWGNFVLAKPANRLVGKGRQRAKRDLAHSLQPPCQAHRREVCSPPIIMVSSPFALQADQFTIIHQNYTNKGNARMLNVGILECAASGGGDLEPCSANMHHALAMNS